jgi:hypothetical protein
MKFVPWFSAAGSALSRRPIDVGVGAFALALAGCGGSTYNVGNVTGDAGSGVIADAGSAKEDAPRDTFCDLDCGPGSSTFSSADGGTTPPMTGCNPASVGCTGGAIGYSCASTGDMPDAGSLVCMSVGGGFNPSFCCIPWSDPSGACAPLSEFPCDGYAFQCSPGSSPPSVDAMLTCGPSFPDNNGNNDYCCTHH